MRSDPSILNLSRLLLRALVALNLLMGVGIAIMLAWSLVAKTQLLVMLGAPANAGPELVWGMRAVMVLGIAAVPLTHVLLTRLLAIVDTVRAGDPFVAANAARLQTIAWALLGLELLHLGVGAVAAGGASGGDRFDLDWNFSISGWLAVLLLFVLARVFHHGALMREDLEGTV